MSSSATPPARPRPPPTPLKPAHLSRLSFPRPLSSSPAAAAPAAFDGAQLASTAYMQASSLERRGSTESIREKQLEEEKEEEEEDGRKVGDTWDGVQGRDAWTLWPFQAHDPSELSFDGRTHIQILSHRLPPTEHAQEDEDDINAGWSLARAVGSGRVGLLPTGYFSYSYPDPTDDMLPKSTPIPKPLIRPSPSPAQSHGPTSFKPPVEPLKPQPTGSGPVRSFSQSILKGRSINRFSAFVTGGAEAWILDGLGPTAMGGEEEGEQGGHERFSSTDSERSEGEYKEEAGRRGVSQADLHFVDSGPSWKAKTPTFEIRVHSPQKRKSLVGLSEYTIYLVTSIFPTEEGLTDVPEITVERRFSNFLTLHAHLSRKFPSLALPPVPEKNLSGRFADEFVETRRGDLERWVRRVGRHPVLRYAEAVVGFLGVEDEEEWTRLCPSLEKDDQVGPLFYANIFHPSFNVDLEDAQETIDRFERHVEASDKSLQGLRETFARFREGEKDRANVHRVLAYHLLALVSSKQVGQDSPSFKNLIEATGEEGEGEGTGQKSALNSDGAWCFREDCEECLGLTKALQRVAEGLSDVADLCVEHASNSLLATAEGLKDMAHPSSLYAPIIETHRSTLCRYADLLAEADMPSDDPDILPSASPMESANRCETVLNATLSETSQYHDTKNDDLKQLTVTFLDDEIAHHERVLERLKSARKTFDEPGFGALGKSPREPSRLEEELGRPTQAIIQNLRQPSPHINDSIVRPVTAAASALNDSVVSLWGGATGGRRLSRWLW